MSHAFWLGMMNEGIIPQPPGPDEQWTISVQHTDADVDAHLKAFAKVAPLLKKLAG
jgi:glutamate-1-semialdehyde 2,1-aminomutase